MGACWYLDSNNGSFGDQKKKILLEATKPPTGTILSLCDPCNTASCFSRKCNGNIKTAHNKFHCASGYASVIPEHKRTISRILGYNIFVRIFCVKMRLNMWFLKSE